ncbi:MAG: phosphotransferase [Anaerolineales bacterium]|jgi:aminoglycoside phosphotransferase (APT) family kinase protein
MQNPQKHLDKFKTYFSTALGAEVVIQHFEMLRKSTREAPWRFDLLIDGEPRSFVFRMHTRTSAREYKVLEALQDVQVPTPHVYGLDKKGKTFGQPCYFMDYIEGESLLKPLLAGETWAEELYIDSTIRLFTLPEETLANLPAWVEHSSAEDLLDHAYQKLKQFNDLVARRVYQELKLNVPPLPEIRFSNGDLYPDNFIVRDRQLVGVIDFANASYGDPLFEFMLPMFIHRDLRGRGLEERFCARIGIQSGNLDWYHVLEYYDLWGFLAGTKDDFVGHTAESIRNSLADWLKKGKLV